MARVGVSVSQGENEYIDLHEMFFPNWCSRTRNLLPKEKLRWRLARA
jgi:hypothetical protein